jgi:membrane fusion protein, multidrug efflux system
MNNKIIFTIATVALLGACKNGQKKVDNSKLLAEAKKEQTALKEKIAKLEESLGKKDSVRAIPVEINSMTPTTFINYIDVQGKVDASNNTLASPEVPGVIQNIFVHLGQFVRKGQVIASLKTTQLNTVADGIRSANYFCQNFIRQAKKIVGSGNWNRGATAWSKK